MKIHLSSVIIPVIITFAMLDGSLELAKRTQLGDLDFTITHTDPFKTRLEEAGYSKENIDYISSLAILKEKVKREEALKAEIQELLRSKPNVSVK